MTVPGNPDRRSGILLGFLAGNALGCPLDHLKAGRVLQLLGVDAEVGYLAVVPGLEAEPLRQWVCGLHASRGQEVLALCAGAADDQSGRGPLARGAALLADLGGQDVPADEDPNATGALRGAGRPLRRAAGRWRRDYPWDLDDFFATAEPSQGLGPACRAVASTLVPGIDPIEAARLTHVHEYPLVAAAIIRDALVALASGDASPQDLLAELAVAARQHEDSLRDGPVSELWREAGWGFPPERLSAGLEPLAKLVDLADDALAERTLLGQVAGYRPAQPIAQVQSGFAPVLLPWVLYLCLSRKSPAHVVEAAVRGGGEPGLAAALAGALAGAQWGSERLLPEWCDGLLARGIAGGFLGEEVSLAAVESWQSAEGAWSARLAALRAPLFRKAAEARAAAPPKAPRKKPSDAPSRQDGPFAPPPSVWLAEEADDLAPWEKKRLKAERGRKRTPWKEERRRRGRESPGDPPDDTA